MIDREVTFLLIGAGVALVSSIVTALVQHFLSLRADRIKRAWDQEERTIAERRNSLLDGVRKIFPEGKTIILKSRDGSRLEVPANTSPEEIDKIMEKLREIDTITISL